MYSSQRKGTASNGKAEPTCFSLLAPYYDSINFSRTLRVSNPRITCDLGSHLSYTIFTLSFLGALEGRQDFTSVILDPCRRSLRQSPRLPFATSQLRTITILPFSIATSIGSIYTLAEDRGSSATASIPLSCPPLLPHSQIIHTDQHGRPDT